MQQIQKKGGQARGIPYPCGRQRGAFPEQVAGMTRRRVADTSLAGALAGALRADPARRRPRILLRSSWQVVNIGDIAHTPGVLALIERHIPEADVVLWASEDLGVEVAAMERRRFPALRIVKGSLGSTGQASTAELGEAVAWCDFLLHGSGPGFVARRDVAAFARHTGKPFGVYGISYGGGDADTIALMCRARFLYFRDSVSLQKARDDGVAAPIMAFGPDGAFACDLRHDQAAAAFLHANGLKEGGFVCCIPRLRYTPYWSIRNRPMDAEDRRRHARNEAMKERDHAPLRETICAITRETGLKVLVCPEDMSQMAVGRDMLVDTLPPAVRRNVVWRESFWLTDEALSTYVRSAGLFGLEMHAPILCVGNGVPAIVCRFAEQTSKGFMWRDIGLGDWLFDFDRDADLRHLTPAVLNMLRHPAASREKTARARAFVHERFQDSMGALRRQLAI
jgi:polysaccharide pyruvyl transferase WcaK-like protein